MSLEFVFGNIPPASAGGFHFIQKLRDGGEEPITASTKKELDEKLLDFRVKNGLEVGNPEAETNAYLCSRWPRFCRETANTEADESKGTLRQRTTNWRVNRFSQAQQEYELESEEVAETRSAICEGCPKNQDNSTGCRPCVIENDRVLFMLRKGRSVSNQSQLGGCEITGQDNATAVWMTGKMLAYANKYQDQLPDFCWLKK